MGIYFRYLALILLLAGCWRIPTDVNFITDPRVLRGTWTGTTKASCNNNNPFNTSGVINSLGTQFFVISAKTLEVFDAANGTKLGGFILSSTTLPVIWSPDGTNIIYLRTTATSTIERAVVNPLNGADISATTIPNDFAGTSFYYNNDLTRVAAFATSNFSGLARVDLYNLVSGVLIKSKSFSSINPSSISLNSLGTKISFTATDSNKFQVWQHDFNSDLSSKVFEREAQNFSLLSSPTFSGANQLTFVYNDFANSSFKLNIKRINLTDLSNQDTLLPSNAGQVRVTPDGTRYAFVENDTLFVYNLETNALITQKPFNTISNNNYVPTFATIISSNETGTIWLISGTRLGCTVRTFTTTNQSLTADSSLITDDGKAVIMTFVPTYRDSKSYTFTGTIKIGSDAAKNIRGFVGVANQCSLFGSACENLTPQTSPPIPAPYQLTKVHDVTIEYATGSSFEYPLVVVGYMYDLKKVQIFAWNYNNQVENIVLNPPSTP
jgi:hypothetical protein